MNLYWRLATLLIGLRLKKPAKILGTFETRFRCWLTDLDVFGHMNNARYFSLMDLARVDLMGRSGLLKLSKSKGWYPVVVAETARFKKSLKLFDGFTIRTSIIGWDERAVLIAQNFYRKEELVCEAVIRGLFLKKSGGRVTIDELLKEAKVETTPPKLADWISQWNAQQGSGLS